MIRYWLTPSDDPAFDDKVMNICTLYHEAPERAARGEHIMSTDELTGVQALEPTQPDLPTAPGLVRRREYEYIRHGTASFMLNRDVVSGQVVAPSAGPTRTEEDFAVHIAYTVDTDPDASAWHFVVDNLNTHQSETLVRLVADRCGITDDLGVKGKRGILTAQAQPRRLPGRPDPPHRVSLYPRSCLLDEPNRDLAEHPDPQTPQMGHLHLHR